MDMIFSGATSDSQIDQNPLIQRRMDRCKEHEHIIDMTNHEESSSNSPSEDLVESPLGQSDAQPSNNRDRFTDQSSSREISRSSSVTLRGYENIVQRRPLLSSGLWIVIEFLISLGQIIASIIVLSLSSNENPHAPLFIWVLGYASGCVITLPVLLWRFNATSLEPHLDPTPESGRLDVTPLNQVSQSSDLQLASSSSNRHPNSFIARLSAVMELLKVALDCFFAVWFVVGNVWIFGGHINPSDAPKLYRLCIVFLTFSFIGYAMPFILCTTICCCMPCIITMLGIRDNFSSTRGATEECINSLPTYKFKSKSKKKECKEGDGGIIAAGTDKERVLSVEDASCCICLTKYADEDELRDLPCSHVFHVHCVDKWLKMNASCPLCKSVITERNP